MSGDNDEGALRDLLEIWFEYHSLPFEHLHDKSIVNDLMVHIDRCRMGRHDLHEHTDSTMDSGTVASRECGEDRKQGIVDRDSR